MSDTSEDQAPKRPRRKRKSYSLLILAAGLFLFGIAAGTLYYFLRPVTLTIAVAPPGSDDQKLIQALAQTFARDQSPVRLSPVVTENTAESIAALTSSKADMAVARADLNLPANADAVAILRKNVVVLWAPSGLRTKGSRRPPTPKIESIDDLDGHRVGRSRLDPFGDLAPVRQRYSKARIGRQSHRREAVRGQEVDVDPEPGSATRQRG